MLMASSHSVINVWPPRFSWRDVGTAGESTGECGVRSVVSGFGRKESKDGRRGKEKLRREKKSLRKLPEVPNETQRRGNRYLKLKYK